jgi:hypothetical protein
MRLACGTVDAEEPEGPIENATVWEVVVDAGEARPRFSLIRDITQLDLAMSLAGIMPDEPEAGPTFAPREEFAADSQTGPGVDSGADPETDPEMLAGPGFGDRSGSGVRSGRGGRSTDGDAFADETPDPEESSTEVAGSSSRRGPIGRWRPLR